MVIDANARREAAAARVGKMIPPSTSDSSVRAPGEPIILPNDNHQQAYSKIQANAFAKMQQQQQQQAPKDFLSLEDSSPLASPTSAGFMSSPPRRMRPSSSSSSSLAFNGQTAFRRPSYGTDTTDTFPVTVLSSPRELEHLASARDSPTPDHVDPIMMATAHVQTSAETISEEETTTSSPPSSSSLPSSPDLDQGSSEQNTSHEVQHSEDEEVEKESFLTWPYAPHATTYAGRPVPIDAYLLKKLDEWDAYDLLVAKSIQQHAAALEQQQRAQAERARSSSSASMTGGGQRPRAASVSRKSERKPATGSSSNSGSGSGKLAVGLKKILRGAGSKSSNSLGSSASSQMSKTDSALERSTPSPSFAATGSTSSFSSPILPSSMMHTLSSGGQSPSDRRSPQVPHGRLASTGASTQFSYDSTFGGSSSLLDPASFSPLWLNAGGASSFTSTTDPSRSFISSTGSNAASAIKDEDETTANRVRASTDPCPPAVPVAFTTSSQYLVTSTSPQRPYLRPSATASHISHASNSSSNSGSKWFGRRPRTSEAPSGHPAQASGMVTPQPQGILQRAGHPSSRALRDEFVAPTPSPSAGDQMNGSTPRTKFADSVGSRSDSVHGSAKSGSAGASSQANARAAAAAVDPRAYFNYEEVRQRGQDLWAHLDAVLPSDQKWPASAASGLPAEFVTVPAASPSKDTQSTGQSIGSAEDYMLLYSLGAFDLNDPPHLNFISSSTAFARTPSGGKTTLQPAKFHGDKSVGEGSLFYRPTALTTVAQQLDAGEENIEARRAAAKEAERRASEMTIGLGEFSRSLMHTPSTHDEAEHADDLLLGVAHSTPDQHGAIAGGRAPSQYFSRSGREGLPSMTSSSSLAFSFSLAGAAAFSAQKTLQDLVVHAAETVVCASTAALNQVKDGLDQELAYHEEVDEEEQEHDIRQAVYRMALAHREHVHAIAEELQATTDATTGSSSTSVSALWSPHPDQSGSDDIARKRVWRVTSRSPDMSSDDSDAQSKSLDLLPSGLTAPFPIFEPLRLAALHRSRALMKLVKNAKQGTSQYSRPAIPQTTMSLMEELGEDRGAETTQSETPEGTIRAHLNLIQNGLDGCEVKLWAVDRDHATCLFASGRDASRTTARTQVEGCDAEFVLLRHALLNRNECLTINDTIADFRFAALEDVPVSFAAWPVVDVHGLPVASITITCSQPAFGGCSLASDVLFSASEAISQAVFAEDIKEIINRTSSLQEDAESFSSIIQNIGFHRITSDLRKLQKEKTRSRQVAESIMDEVQDVIEKEEMIDTLRSNLSISKKDVQTELVPALYKAVVDCVYSALHAELVYLVHTRGTESIVAAMQGWRERELGAFELEHMAHSASSAGTPTLFHHLQTQPTKRARHALPWWVFRQDQPLYRSGCILQLSHSADMILVILFTDPARLLTLQERRFVLDAAARLSTCLLQATAIMQSV